MRKTGKARNNKPEIQPEPEQAVGEGCDEAQNNIQRGSKRDKPPGGQALATREPEETSMSIPREAARRLIPTLPAEEPDFTGLLVFQAVRTTLPFGDSPDRFTDRFIQAAVRSLQPHDALEALLAVQMVRTHNLAIEYLGRAAFKDQTTVGIELFTNFANRLLRTFAAQVEALKTYRSKGQQKVEVEHVHVHRGGQAIVGAVSHTTTGGGDDNKE